MRPLENACASPVNESGEKGSEWSAAPLRAVNASPPAERLPYHMGVPSPALRKPDIVRNQRVLCYLRDPALHEV